VATAATILGSGGFVPTGQRETSSLLLLPEKSDAALVVDAGTGMRRLVTDPGLLEERTELHIVLTHFHIDHVCGLAYLTGVDLPTHVHGPGVALYDTPTAELLARVFSRPIMPIGLDVMGVEVTELGIGSSEIAGLEVRTRRQDNHTDPTLGLRFGDELVWCTDTAEDPGTVAFARGVRILAHDAWGPPAAPGHAEPEGAGRIAHDAGADELLLIHVPPLADVEALRAGAAGFHRHVTVATDGLRVL
jgi:ribonuclease BN (tRNA processing enzyme)